MGREISRDDVPVGWGVGFRLVHSQRMDQSKPCSAQRRTMLGWMPTALAKSEVLRFFMMALIIPTFGLSF